MRHDARTTQTLHEVRAEFETWRKNRPRREPIPESLWAAATEIAVKEGVWHTARALRLNNTELKKRIAGSSSVKALSRSKPSSSLAKMTPEFSFVELLPSPAGDTIGECAVEVEIECGVRMRIQMKQVAPKALATLIRECAQ